MKSFREYLNESRQNSLEEGSIFSSNGKSPLDLLDSAVKSIKGMIDNLNDIKEIKDFNKAKKEAKLLASFLIEANFKFLNLRNTKNLLFEMNHHQIYLKLVSGF